MDGIDYRTTDNTKWGAGTGGGTAGNLTAGQVDGNFWELYTRLKSIEDNPPEAVSIMGFTVIGSQLQVNMTDGTTQGPFTLPVATFRMMGNWVNDMPLLPLDVITVPHDGVYFVNIEHTTPPAPATFDANADDGSGNLLYSKVFGDDAAIYDLGWFFPGSPGLGIEDGAPIAGHEFVRAVVCPIDLVDSKASVRVPHAVDTSYPLQVNGTDVGSVDFASGDTAGTFTFADEVSCAAGDVIHLLRPDAIDSAAKDLSVTLTLTRHFDT